MHWRECGAGADLTAGPCRCRNDEPERYRAVLDPDPLDVTSAEERQREIDGYLDRYYATGRWDWERPDADFAEQLRRFREQGRERRAARWLPFLVLAVGMGLLVVLVVVAASR
jgi:hypothetical protein